MKNRVLWVVAAMMAAFGTVKAQESTDEHPYSPVDGYIVPTDKAVLQKLSQWQDLKFGVLFHWGVYSVPGIMESWSLCGEDEQWEYDERIRRNMTLEGFRNWYWGLNKELNPVKFAPEKWADIMKDAGMKYMVLTSKHHDGFCMFDSKYTDYSITHGPFAGNPRSNVLKEAFQAFREKGFMIGCYFSKPDWHCPYFWNPLLASPNRFQNYEIKRHPDWWNKYVEYTQNQLMELTTDYGNIDILWLDGGWIDGSQVGLDKVLEGARQRNPGLISVDRACRNKNENYQTPEGVVPPTQRNIPWETCYPMDAWGWKANPNYKTSNAIVAMLIEVVAKGGNLLLGVGPTPEGEIDALAQSRLSEVGKWLKKNGTAVYNTCITPHYNDGKVWFNAAKDGKTLYALYAYDDKDGQSPTTIEWTDNIPKGKMRFVATGKNVKYRVDGNKVTVTLPANMPKESFALAFAKK